MAVSSLNHANTEYPKSGSSQKLRTARSYDQLQSEHQIHRVIVRGALIVRL